MAEMDVERRENDQAIDRIQTQLRGSLITRRLYFLWLLASLIGVGFLGWALLVGVWSHYRGPFSVLGLAAALVSTSGAFWQIIKMRPNVARTAYDLSVLQTKRMHLAAAHEADPLTALRIYRVGTLNDIDQYRRSANRNRRYSNILQWLIIVGSVTATSLTSASTAAGSLQWFRWVAAGVSAVVSIAAGVTGFFKFRERGFNQQQTADTIEKHYKAAELSIGDYDGLEEPEALRKLARAVEELKDEQRKRELQLEQSSSERREHQPA